MKIIKKGLGDGSCNFCDKSKLGAGGKSLVYPYGHVTEISKDNGSGASVRFCDDCLNELITANREIDRK